MKLYMHPVSTVCRPIRLLCAENGIDILKHWDEVNRVFSGFVAGNNGKEFVRIA
ncbi:MAG TPA: glutathione S-transferase N-terminal domain-containing protein [Xanthobacteraceae bacterium]|jgi:hypothetical protein